MGWRRGLERNFEKFRKRNHNRKIKTDLAILWFCVGVIVLRLHRDSQAPAVFPPEKAVQAPGSQKGDAPRDGVLRNWYFWFREHVLDRVC